MVAKTIKTMTQVLRCVRFDKTESPTWENDGLGWTEDGMIEALEKMEVEYTQAVDHDAFRVYRFQPPSAGKVGIKDLLVGGEGWFNA